MLRTSRTTLVVFQVVVCALGILVLAGAVTSAQQGDLGWAALKALFAFNYALLAIINYQRLHRG